MDAMCIDGDGKWDRERNRERNRDERARSMPKRTNRPTKEEKRLMKQREREA